MASKTAVASCTIHTGSHFEEPVEIDHYLFTEYALRQRGFTLRTQGWLTGFYHWNRPRARVGCGDPQDPDAYGWVEVAFCPIGEQRNSWAENTWRRSYPAIYAWYMNDNDMRAFRHGCILFIKSDVYIHTDGTYDADNPLMGDYDDEEYDDDDDDDDEEYDDD